MPQNEIRQMDVYWTDFPYSDGHVVKKRPVLVISRDDYNRGPDVLACGITSSMLARPYSVVMSARHFMQGKLPLESRVRSDKMLSIEKRKMDALIGRVSPEFFALVVKQIRLLIEEK
ncbi:type II toxin-antitoxin system PemK/MazF family toxin [Candidatus Micrarchaeota archaeon]|nr:type II toxin-antitoxin system PemK/MazF family toxin [Candidatus Micrarchaeota archaeon]